MLEKLRDVYESRILLFRLSTKMKIYIEQNLKSRTTTHQAAQPKQSQQKQVRILYNVSKCRRVSICKRVRFLKSGPMHMYWQCNLVKCIVEASRSVLNYVHIKYTRATTYHWHATHRRGRHEKEKKQKLSPFLAFKQVLSKHGSTSRAHLRDAN